MGSEILAMVDLAIFFWERDTWPFSQAYEDVAMLEFSVRVKWQLSYNKRPPGPGATYARLHGTISFSKQ